MRDDHMVRPPIPCIKGAPLAGRFNSLQDSLKIVSSLSFIFFQRCCRFAGNNFKLALTHKTENCRFNVWQQIHKELVGGVAFIICLFIRRQLSTSLWRKFITTKTASWPRQILLLLLQMCAPSRLALKGGVHQSQRDIQGTTTIGIRASTGRKTSRAIRTAPFSSNILHRTPFYSRFTPFSALILSLLRVRTVTTPRWVELRPA